MIKYYVKILIKVVRFIFFFSKTKNIRKMVYFDKITQEDGKGRSRRRQKFVQELELSFSGPLSIDKELCGRKKNK